MNKFEYLNLELRNKSCHEIKTDEFKHNCYFNKAFDHRLHGEDYQLNSVTDMIMSLSKSVEDLNISHNKLLYKMNVLLEENTLDTKKIKMNQQYMKDQIEVLIGKCPLVKDTTNIEGLIRQVEKIEKNNMIIEQMLENIKNIVLA